MFQQVLILTACALLLGQIRAGRSLVLMAASALAVFWLQPDTDPQNLTFWLPTATLGLAGLAWYLTSPPETRSWRKNLPAVLVLSALVVLIDLNRYFNLANFLTIFTPRPPVLAAVLAVMALLLVAIAFSRKWERLWLALLLVVTLLGFLMVKIPSAMLAGVLPFLNGAGGISLPLALRWLGFSYIAFRLIHTIRDRQSGRLAAVSLAEYVTYIVFFPALSAGPIDRIEHFVPQLRQPLPLTRDDWLFVIQRIFFGLFKKFVLADALAISALNDGLAQNIHSTVWMWVSVYAYALQIYLDFSGYTDIVIGMGRLMGFRLPENFASPYLKPNITQFWNNWHMTLTQWFRAYTFNPLTRFLRRTRLPAWLTLALVQFTTMILIGMWHGVTWNYALWGVWHALGLFIHNRWSEWLLPRSSLTQSSGLRKWVLLSSGVVLTFQFVALGWVFFALSTPALSGRVFLILFGLSQ